MNDRTLLINQPFALRQRNGMPVFTKIGTLEKPYTELEINDIINNLNKQRRNYGLTVVDSFDIEYAENLRNKSKKSRIKIDYPINVSVLKRILITPNGKGYMSTYFLDFCKVHQIPIYFIDAKGRVEASFIPFHYLKTSLAMKQYEAKSNGKDLEIAKYLITLKLESMKMEKFIPNLRKAKDIHTVVSLEAIATAKYHSDWEFPKEWNYEGRRHKDVRTRTNHKRTASEDC